MSSLLRNVAGLGLAISLFGAVAGGQEYQQTNLVANMGSAPTIDSDLVNSWGLARGSATPWWVADNATGNLTVYNGSGNKLPLTVTVPGAKSGAMGTPTGLMYNGSTTDFMLGSSGAALYLFCTLDGTIAGWNHAGGVMVMVKTTDGSSYTGLTSTTLNGKLYLYAANFTKGRVDVYDSFFKRVHLGGQDSGWRGNNNWRGQDNGRGQDGGAFRDEQLPADYVPYNVQAIGSNIVVTYALHEEGNRFETDGPGLGYVDIYSADGHLVMSLQHGDWLNAPWGVALTPLDFGMYSHDLLVGQFAGGGPTQSSGYIAAYDMASGRFVGLLQDATGKPLAINGIWAISPGNTSPNNFDSAGAPAAELYFTAGPRHGAGGLFGYLTPVSTELTEGNDQ